MEGAIAGVIQSVFHPKAAGKAALRAAGKLAGTGAGSAGDRKYDLLNEIETVRKSLNNVSARFEFQSDPDLVESCIYEMQSLTARYRYLLREARRLGVTGDMAASVYRTAGERAASAQQGA